MKSNPNLKSVRVYIANEVYSFPIKYLLELIGKNKNIDFIFLPTTENCDLILDHHDPGSKPITFDFYNQLAKPLESLSFQCNFFAYKPLISTNSGEPDYLASIFYLINCLQEYNPAPTDLDEFGRYKYERSCQNRFGFIKENLVQEYIDLFLASCGVRSNFSFKTTIFLSHDIDTLYGSLLQDGLWALKKGRLDVIIEIIFREMIRKPEWRNIDKILKIESAYDLVSTFFWLVNKGIGKDHIQNADYSVQKERELFNNIIQNGFTNGLHKSSSKMSLDEELDRLPYKTTFNRYHFLKFLPQYDWQLINESRIEFDSSLGFAEHYGFRNSFGMPFQPYNLQLKKPFNFVETPLNIMDGTFHKYMQIPVNRTSEMIIEFIEKNRFNCVLSLLWHNTYFTNYKYGGFLSEYQKILVYLYESGIESITPKRIIDKFKIA
jgi:hypothetical protein